MKRSLLLISAFVAISFSTAAAASLWQSSKGRFSVLISRLEWEPGYGCNKPMRPYSRDRYALESYKRNALTYLECIEEAARADQKYAARVVQEGYEKAADDFLAEVKRGY